MKTRLQFRALVSLSTLLVLWAVAAPSISAQEFSTGLILASPEELRGIPLAAMPFSGAELPAHVDLSGDMPPPMHQGNQQSCVGFAMAYALKSYQEKLEEDRAFLNESGQVRGDRVFSPAFIYNQINRKRDGGCLYVDALNLISEQGVSTWSDMPYRANDHLSQPSENARTNAKRFRIDYWRRVNVAAPREVKAQLASGFPVLIGASVDEGFKKARSGHVWRSVEGKVLGGHAMVLVGFDDAKRAFKVMNSWGPGWGENGFGWIDYEFFRKVVSEGYVAKDAITAPEAGADLTDDLFDDWKLPDDFDKGLFDSDYNPFQFEPSSEVVTFALTNVDHNIEMPDSWEVGRYMKISGIVKIPWSAGLENQDVVHFYFDAGGGARGAAVQSRNPRFSNIYGFATTATGSYPIPPGGTNATWSTVIPYSALDVPVGQWVDTPQGPQYEPRVTQLVAEPVLFIDGFGVKSGGLFRFYVKK